LSFFSSLNGNWVAHETLLPVEDGGANGGKNRRKKIALLGETFRGNRQGKFLFDLFLSKCAEGKALRIMMEEATILPQHYSYLSGMGTRRAKPLYGFG